MMNYPMSAPTWVPFNITPRQRTEETMGAFAICLKLNKLSKNQKNIL